MDNKDRTILEKILKEIDFLQADIKGIDHETFMGSERIRRCVAMTLINIGELIHVLSKQTKDSAPDIPFREIKATRNIVAHHYGTLNFNVIWNTITESVPDLKAKIAALL